MKQKHAIEPDAKPQDEAQDETEVFGTIIAIVLGIIFLAWIIFITPAIINTVFWKP